VVSKLQLMADPHLEDDAQAEHEIFVHHFEPAFDAQQVYFLRIILTQPSPLWLQHTIRELRFFSAWSSHPTGPPCSSLDQLDGGEGAKRVDAFSSELLALLQVARQIHSTLLEVSPSRRNESERGSAYILGEWEDELRL